MLYEFWKDITFGNKKYSRYLSGSCTNNFNC